MRERGPCEYLGQLTPEPALLPAEPWAAAKVRKLLDKNIAGFKRLARFAPYVAGETFTLADCGAFVHLPLVALATRTVHGDDLLARHGVDWKANGPLVGLRASAQRIDADREADQAASIAAAQARR